ncbi:MAG: histidinol phosphate phosphatase [Phycisphaerae bacterium]|nr:MAG: histidinol phosphate phosphatase [Phycisphaerae bacterium]
MDHAIADRLDAARAMAAEAGALVMRYFQRDGLSVETKSDGTPVTRADREAEEFLRDRIRSRYPDDGLVGEEYGEHAGRGAFRWVIDPIDGTKSFARGVPLFGTLLAVERQAAGLWRSVVGVVEMPALGETVFAGEGLGAWHVAGGVRRAARVSHVGSLREALMVHTGPEYTESAGAGSAQRRLTGACGLVRGWSDCYGLVLVATGRAEVWFEPSVKPWDIAPAPVILHEAGGKFTDWRGDESAYGGNGLGTNGLVHADAMALIRA